jgi:hypothetical protein
MDARLITGHRRLDGGASMLSPRRKSIASFMKLVAIVALNLGIGRMIFLFEPWRLAGIAPMAVVIQFGLFFLVRSSGRPRRYAFWLGFETGGLLGIWSFLYARVPDSAVGACWEEYAAFINDLLRVHLGLSVFDRGPADPALLIVVAVFGSLPQMLMAIAGGLLGLSLGWSRRSPILLFKLIALAGLLYALTIFLLH